MKALVCWDLWPSVQCWNASVYQLRFMAIYVLLVGKDPSFWNFELLKNHQAYPITKTTLLGNRGAWSRFPSLVLNSRILIYGFVVKKKKIKNKNVLWIRETEKTSFTHMHVSFRRESFCPSSLSRERPLGNSCYSVPGKMLYTKLYTI